VHKTTLYLPETLEHEIAAAARMLGISKAAFMRRAIEQVAAETQAAKRTRRRSYTLLPAGRGSATVEEMKRAIVESMERRASKR
jgi:hypothetical protein